MIFSMFTSEVNFVLKIKANNVCLFLLELKLKTQIRSSRPEVFGKKAVLKKFAKFIGKHLCWSLF